jgi:hypothetical protein
MANFDAFKAKDRVALIGIGDGTVLAVDDFVHVEFDNGRAYGKYSREWFNTHPHFLFHRAATKES